MFSFFPCFCVSSKLQRSVGSPGAGVEDRGKDSGRRSGEFLPYSQVKAFLRLVRALGKVEAFVDVKMVKGH